MKKAICMILSLIILCSFTSCGNNNQSNNDNSNTPTNTSPSLTTAHTHSYSPATCQNPKTCTGCDQTEGETIAHDSVDGKCSMCGLDYFEELGRIIQENGEEDTYFLDHTKYYIYEIENLDHSWYSSNPIVHYNPEHGTINFYIYSDYGDFRLSMDKASLKFQEYEWSSSPDFGDFSNARGEISGIVDAKKFSRNSQLKYEKNTFAQAEKGDRFVSSATMIFSTLILESTLPALLEKSDYNITVGHFGFVRFE